MLYSIKAEGSQPDCVFDGGVHLAHRKGFQQTQHLHVLPALPLRPILDSSRRRSVPNSPGRSQSCSGAAWSRAPIFCSSSGR